MFRQNQFITLNILLFNKIKTIIEILIRSTGKQYRKHTNEHFKIY